MGTVKQRSIKARMITLVFSVSIRILVLNILAILMCNSPTCICYSTSNVTYPHISHGVNTGYDEVLGTYEKPKSFKLLPAILFHLVLYVLQNLDLCVLLHSKYY